MYKTILKHETDSGAASCVELGANCHEPCGLISMRSNFCCDNSHRIPTHIIIRIKSQYLPTRVDVGAQLCLVKLVLDVILF